MEDQDWNDDNWLAFIKQEIVATGLASFKEIACLTLGHLNPTQVGTSVASKKNFQIDYKKGKCWREVKKWFYAQKGTCDDCGTRLELQVDHIQTKQDFGDEADRLENITLRCRRCNVIRRPSHKKGGLTYLTTESALMWILLSKKPTRYDAYEKICREYGLTMANIRIQEAWAMAEWLEKENQYYIKRTNKELVMAFARAVHSRDSDKSKVLMNQLLERMSQDATDPNAAYQQA